MTIQELLEELRPEGRIKPGTIELIAERYMYHIYFEQNINGFPQLIKCDEKDVEIDDENKRIILR